MELLEGRISKLFFRFLVASFGSALMVSIYSLVDSAMVGRYEGAQGVAALATVAPIWNIIYSLGLLFGIGGSVMVSNARGSNQKAWGDRIFTLSFLATIVFAMISWIGIGLFGRELLYVFGADDALADLALTYLQPIQIVLPLYMIGQHLIPMIRCDNRPALTTIAVICGGLFNIFGDYFFVFVCDMGIYGAGLATAIGQVISILILLSHFFHKDCTLVFEKPKEWFHSLKQIIMIGFSSFFVDIAMGILSVMFNHQIMRYFDSDALAVYGVIINVSTLVQACAYGIGQAAQPIISMNYGAKKMERIRKTLYYSLATVVFFTVLWLCISMHMPMTLLSMFMEPTASIQAMAPDVLRMYFLSFLFLTYNIYLTYYFQAVMKPKISFLLSILRGFVLSGILIFILPMISTSMLWLAMPLSELLIAIIGSVYLVFSYRKLR